VSFSPKKIPYCISKGRNLVVDNDDFFCGYMRPYVFEYKGHIGFDVQASDGVLCHCRLLRGEAVIGCRVRFV